MSVAGRNVARAVLATVDGLALLAPAVGVSLAAVGDGLRWTTHLDLLVASAVLAVVHATITARRLGHGPDGVPDRSTWFATIDAVIVLAVVASGIAAWALYYQAVPVRRVVDSGVPVVAVWVALQLVGIAVAELTRLLVRRWLARDAWEGDGAPAEAAMFGPRHWRDTRRVTVHPRKGGVAAAHPPDGGAGIGSRRRTATGGYPWRC